MSEHKHTEKVLSDIESTIEHLNMIKKMIIDHQTCVNVLNQISGVFVRLNETRTTIVNDHIKSCISAEKLEDTSQLSREIEQIIKAVVSGPSTGSHH